MHLAKGQLRIAITLSGATPLLKIVSGHTRSTVLSILNYTTASSYALLIARMDAGDDHLLGLRV